MLKILQKNDKIIKLSKLIIILKTVRKIWFQIWSCVMVMHLAKRIFATMNGYGTNGYEVIFKKIILYFY